MANTSTITNIGDNLTFNLMGGTTLVPISVASSSISGISPQPFAFTYGVGVGQMNVFYWENLTLAASGTLTIDLTNNAGTGSLTDPLGGILQAFVRVKWIRLYLYNITGYTASSVTLGQGGTYPFVGPWGSGGSMNVYNGVANTNGICSKAETLRTDGTGWTITGATNNNIKLTNNDSVNSAQVGLYIGGCNA